MCLLVLILIGCSRSDAEPLAASSVDVVPPAPASGAEPDGGPELPSADPIPAVDVPPASPWRCRIPNATETNIETRAESVAYASPNGTPVELDVFGPARQGAPAPALLLIHGGAWRAGRRAHVTLMARHFAAAGYVTIPVDYRLVRRSDPAPEGVPAAVQDVQCALRHVHANADAYGVDRHRIAAVGFSAGAHLAALLGTAGGAAELRTECADPEGERIAAAVGFYGPYDLNGRYLPAADTAIERFAGVSRDARARFSPITYASGDDPPFLLVHGGRDATVPIRESREFHTALTSAGARSELVAIPHGAHGFSIFHRENRHRRATCATLRFLARELSLPPR